GAGPTCVGSSTNTPLSAQPQAWPPDAYSHGEPPQTCRSTPARRPGLQRMLPVSRGCDVTGRHAVKQLESLVINGRCCCAVAGAEDDQQRATPPERPARAPRKGQAQPVGL